MGLTNTSAAFGLGITCTNLTCSGSAAWNGARFTSYWGASVNGGKNCTNYVAWRLASAGVPQPGATHNANQWDSDAINVWHVPVSSTPRPGDVAQTDAGTYGHVAYVEAVYGDGTILISESNWNGNWLDQRVVSAATFTSYIHFKGLGNFVAPGDFSGDSHPDVISVASDGTLKLYTGNGTGGWLNGLGTSIGGGFSTASAIFSPGDFNGDAHSDMIVVWPSGVMNLYTGNGAGGWANGTGIAIGSGFTGFTAIYSAGDFNGDGFADVVTLASNGVLKLYTGNGSGGWINGTGITIGGGFTGASAPRTLMFPGDFSGDAKPDMIALYPDGSLKLLTGNGVGGWINGTGITIGGGFSSATAVFSPGDFNGDGYVDMIATWPDSSMKLYTGNGAGSWLNGTGISIGSGW